MLLNNDTSELKGYKGSCGVYYTQGRRKLYKSEGAHSLRGTLVGLLKVRSSTQSGGPGAYSLGKF